MDAASFGECIKKFTNTLEGLEKRGNNPLLEYYPLI
jgi:hypothetical protein